MRDRRIAIVYVDEDEILRAVGVWHDCSVFRFRDMTGLPEDAEVRSVNYCPERRGFALAVWSSQFQPVAEGCMTPVWSSPTLWREVTLVKKDDGSYRATVAFATGLDTIQCSAEAKALAACKAAENAIAVAIDLVGKALSQRTGSE